MKTVSVLTLAVLLIVQGGFIYAQNGNWRVSYPPHSGFSIETPVPLLKVISFDGEHGVNYDPGENSRDISSYAAVESSPEECRFGIIVISGRTRARFLRSGPGNELFWYLGAMLIGDDDDPDPERVKVVWADGLKGKEYFYIRKNQDFPNGRTGAFNTRGRIFDTGNEIYVIVFVGQKIDDLTSLDAEHFLNSFHLRRRTFRNRSLNTKGSHLPFAYPH
jgi:hypothetical protein